MARQSEESGRTLLVRTEPRMILDFAITTGATAPLTIGATIIGARIVRAGGVTTIGAKIAQMIGGPIICVAGKKKKISRKRKKKRPQTILMAMIAQ